MKKIYLCLTIGLLGLGTVVHWQASHASEEEPSITVDHKLELVDTLELISRIEGLEKRLAVLEDRDSLVRQADNREPSAVPQPEKFSPMPSATESGLPNSDDSNDTTDVDSEDSQQTNGQKWNFRLLIDRKSQRPSQKAPNHIQNVAPAKSNRRSPTA